MGKVKKRKRSGSGAMPKPPGMNLAQTMRLREQAEAAVIDHAKDEHQKVLGDRQAQRMAWAYDVAVHELYGHGAKRIAELEAKVAEVLRDYEAEKLADDQDVADEHLRRRVEKIKGKPVAIAHDGLPINQDLSEEALMALREAEGRIH